MSEELTVNGLKVVKNEVLDFPNNGCVSVDQALEAQTIDAKESITLNGFTLDSVAANFHESSGAIVTQAYLKTVIQQTVEHVEATMQGRINTAIAETIRDMSEWQPFDGPCWSSSRTNQFFIFPDEVPSGALEVLVYFNVITGRSESSEQNTFTISTASESGPCFKVSANMSDAPAPQYNSQVFWLPYGEGRLNVRSTDSNDLSAIYEIQIIGYRTMPSMA